MNNDSKLVEGTGTHPDKVWKAISKPLNNDKKALPLGLMSSVKK